MRELHQGNLLRPGLGRLFCYNLLFYNFLFLRYILFDYFDTRRHFFRDNGYRFDFCIFFNRKDLGRGESNE